MNGHAAITPAIADRSEGFYHRAAPPQRRTKCRLSLCNFFFLFIFLLFFLFSFFHFFLFIFSQHRFYSNRDSGVISYTMLFLQRRGLVVLLPATSAGGSFWLASLFKRHSWGRGRSLSSSACSAFFLHSEDVDMAVSVRTSPLDHESRGSAGRIGHIPDSPCASESHSGQAPSYQCRSQCRLTVLWARRLACPEQPPETTRSSNIQVSYFAKSLSLRLLAVPSRRDRLLVLVSCFYSHSLLRSHACCVQLCLARA